MSEEEAKKPRRVGAPRHGEKAKVRRNVAVDPDLWEGAILKAHKQGESVSRVIHSALTAYVGVTGDDTKES